ncbi:MAG: zinc-ribbon domain-containing protein [Candidatus Methanoperedens sp.]|nr:zinc-ribbon domain-containing protein [Candidatus Methanoperedens sp.]
MFCQKCGTQNPDDASFCSQCGNQFFFIDKPKSNFPYKPVGIISAIVSILFFPIVFGILSIFCGYKVYKQESEGWGIGISTFGAICMISGLIIGFIEGMKI